MEPPLEPLAGPDVEPGEQEEDQRDRHEHHVLHLKSPRIKSCRRSHARTERALEASPKDYARGYQGGNDGPEAYRIKGRRESAGL